MTAGHNPRPRIFIIYENHEVRLAAALEGLLNCWGFRAFFCRQEVREQATTKGYRDELAEELRNADLVVLLLSNQFQYSPYCQSEAGATVTMEKPQIQITIPPVGYDDIKRISPVLEGRHMVDGRHPKDMVADLRTRIFTHFRNLRAPEATPEICEFEVQVETALADVMQEYRIEPRDKAIYGVWPSLEEKWGTPYSIIEHMKHGMEAGRTLIAVAGVSLKFSLDLISRALTALPKDSGRADARGPLTIEVVHMDDQSHILHSLGDTIDIGNVMKNFHGEWPKIKKSWQKRCKELGIELTVKEPIVIDYLPPQVGILIRTTTKSQNVRSVLYAGKCSFEHIGRETHLLVGEREYAFYSSDHPAGHRRTRDGEAIAVFEDYLEQYRSPKHNGITLVSNHNKWIERLESCIETYHDIDELLLFSNTTTKFYPMIIPALEKGLLVKVYTRYPSSELLSMQERAAVESLPERLESDIQLSGKCTGKLELRHFRHLPTFRAALIGKSVLGLQTYNEKRPDTANAQPPRSEERPPALQLAASDLRLIVTKHSEGFAAMLKMIEGSLRCAGVDKEPYMVFGKRRSKSDSASAGSGAGN